MAPRSRLRDRSRSSDDRSRIGSPENIGGDVRPNVSGRSGRTPGNASASCATTAPGLRSFRSLNSRTRVGSRRGSFRSSQPKIARLSVKQLDVEETVSLVGEPCLGLEPASGVGGRTPAKRTTLDVAQELGWMHPVKPGAGCDPRVNPGKTAGIYLTAKILCVSELDGGEGQNRTVDTTIFSRMLYQLSYLATRNLVLRTDRDHSMRHWSDCSSPAKAGRHVRRSGSTTDVVPGQQRAG